MAPNPTSTGLKKKKPKFPTSQSSQMNRASRERISESGYPLVSDHTGKS
jgi:hypothetical protein